MTIKAIHARKLSMKAAEGELVDGNQTAKTRPCYPTIALESKRLNKYDEAPSREPPTTHNFCIVTIEQACAFRRGLNQLDNEIGRLIILHEMVRMKKTHRLVIILDVITAVIFHILCAIRVKILNVITAARLHILYTIRVSILNIVTVTGSKCSC